MRSVWGKLTYYFSAYYYCIGKACLRFYSLTRVQSRPVRNDLRLLLLHSVASYLDLPSSRVAVLQVYGVARLIDRSIDCTAGGTGMLYYSTVLEQ